MDHRHIDKEKQECGNPRFLGDSIVQSNLLTQLMTRIATVAAVCFVLTALTTLTAELYLASSLQSSQVAQVAADPAAAEVITTVPDSITSPLLVKFELFNATNPVVTLEALDGAYANDLAVTTVSGDTYSFTIPTDSSLHGSEYKFFISALDQQYNFRNLYTSSPFEIAASTQSQYEPPSIDLLTTIPNIIEEPFDVSFELTNASEPQSYLYVQDTDEIIQLSVQKDVARYYFEIPYDDSITSSFTTKIDATDMNNDRVWIFESAALTMAVDIPTSSPAPSATLLTPIPNDISTTTEIRFELSNATDPAVTVLNVATDEESAIAVAGAGSATYSFTLSPDSLVAGTYLLTINAKDTLDEKVTLHTSPEFTITKPTNLTPATPAVVPPPVPEVTLIDTLPRQLATDKTIRFDLSDGSDPKVLLEHRATGDSDSLVVTTITTTRHSFNLPGTTLDPGDYRVTISAKDIDGQRATRYTSDYVTVPLPPQAEFTPITALPTTISEPFTFSFKIENASNPSVSLHTADTNSAKDLPISTISVSDGTYSTVIPVESDTAVEQYLVVSATDLSSEQVVVHTTPKFTAQREVAAIVPPDDTNEIIDDPVVNTDDQSEIVLQPANTTPDINPALDDGSDSATTPRTTSNEPESNPETTITEADPETSSAIFVDIENQPRPSYAEVDETVDEATELLQDFQTPLSVLLQRLADALASEDPALIQAAEAQLATYGEQISTELLESGELAETVDQVKLKVADLSDRVAVLERKRISRTKTLTDTDNDGLWDIDEGDMYNTDPTLPDTDGDGILDGVEIEQGSDPLNPDQEASIKLESPRTTLAPRRDDIFTVTATSVARTAHTQSQSDITETFNQEQIFTGSALPNSLVTLYIFSAPTVVTVRTDADGSFVYTYDKELPSGEHEVYLAITDINGRILGHSSPFSFLIPEAQAFTPVDAEAATLVADTSTTGLSYSFILSLALLVLGIILFLIGLTLRNQSALREPV